MNPLQTLRIALRALLRNKTRSILTTLGIVIGVARRHRDGGDRRGRQEPGRERVRFDGHEPVRRAPRVDERGRRAGRLRIAADADVGRSQGDEDRGARGVGRRAAAPLDGAARRRGAELVTTVYGVTPEYFDIRSWAIADGARFLQSDVDGGAKVVELGQTVVDKLFGPNAHPVGQQVRIKNMPFTVAGVLEKKGQSPTGQDYDDCVYIPVTTFQAKVQGGLQKYLSGTVYVAAKDSASTDKAEGEIRSLLRERHHIADGADDDFSVRNLTEIASAQQESTKTLDHAPRRGRGRLAPRRRDRDHEHHARQRDGADARDRPPHGDRRQALPDPRPVLDRGHGPLVPRWVDGRRPRGRRRGRARQQVRLDDAGATRGGLHRGRLQRA